MSRSTNRGSLLVGAGIFLSRIAGLLREMVSGRVLGNSAAADALVTALRIPNLLQNLLGEGVLSGSFIPVYSAMVDEDERGAGRLAGAVATFLEGKEKALDAKRAALGAVPDVAAAWAAVEACEDPDERRWYWEHAWPLTDDVWATPSSDPEQWMSVRSSTIVWAPS